DVVAGEAPVAVRVEVPERERVGEPERDPRDAVADLARDELQAAARRLVVEEDARHRKQVVALAVVDGDVVPEHLRHAVGAPRVERRELGLRHFTDLAEHLGRGRLVDADPRVDLAHGLEDARHALRVELAGEHRLVPRRRHERHRGEVVELARPHRVDDLDERQLIEEVGRVQVNAIEDLLDAPVIRRAGAADDRVDLVALVRPELREVRAVLAGDAGDERLHLNILRYHRAASAAPYAAQPVQYAAGIDHASAMQTDSTDATTDAAPLSPQSHGVSAAARPLADA